MPANEPTCPQCRVAMDAGHVVDHSYARILTPKWVKGPADWTGIQWWEGQHLKKRDVYRVVSYRCPDCGLLRSFARVPATSKERRGRA